MLTAISLITLVGLSLGLLGGGGSLLAVPALTYGAGLPAQEAIATSLVIVGATSLFALIPHARRGNVAWRVGAAFAGSSMIGAYLGGSLARRFSASTLLIFFATLMVTTALAMLRGRARALEEEAEGERERESGGELSLSLALPIGAAVGVVTGLVGAGGGFLIVPALTLLGGMPLRGAVGTSLMVISLNAFAAFAGHSAHVSVDLPLITTLTLAALGGSVLGASGAARLPTELLRRGFALFVLLMAAYIVAREAGPRPAAGLLAATSAILGWWCRRAKLRPERCPLLLESTAR